MFLLIDRFLYRFSIYTLIAAAKWPLDSLVFVRVRFVLEWLHQREHNAKNEAERRFASRIIGQKSESQRDPSRKREYELNERNPVAKDNYLISILSAGGFFLSWAQDPASFVLPVRSEWHSRYKWILSRKNTDSLIIIIIIITRLALASVLGPFGVASASNKLLCEIASRFDFASACDYF